MTEDTPNCARCRCPYKPSDRLCRDDKGKHPDFCPTRNMPDLVAKSLREYLNRSDLCEFAKQAAYPGGCRIYRPGPRV